MMNLTKKAKGIIAGAGVGLAALGAGLGIWQPWVDKTPDPVPPVDVQPADPKPVVKEEEKLTITAGRDKITCILYEGDGWSIYVPEEWVIDAGENGGKFMAGEGEDAPKVEVIQSKPAVYEGKFVSFMPAALDADTTWQVRTFYAEKDGSGWEVMCQADENVWSEYQYVMNAMARTFSVDGEMIFSGMSPLAGEPEWQITGEGTVLWLDKDGVVVDDAAKEVIAAQMLTWSDETKANFTGRCRMEDLTWAASYTCVAEGEYLEVFETRVWYEVTAGRENEVLKDSDMVLQDGCVCASAATYAVVCHDGSAVKSVEVLEDSLNATGTPAFLKQLGDAE